MPKFGNSCSIRHQTTCVKLPFANGQVALYALAWISGNGWLNERSRLMVNRGWLCLIMNQTPADDVLISNSSNFTIIGTLGNQNANFIAKNIQVAGSFFDEPMFWNVHRQEPKDHPLTYWTDPPRSHSLQSGLSSRSHTPREIHQGSIHASNTIWPSNMKRLEGQSVGLGGQQDWLYTHVEVGQHQQSSRIFAGRLSNI